MTKTKKPIITNIYEAWNETPRMKENGGEAMINGGCCICGKKVGKGSALVHMDTSGNIIPPLKEGQNEEDVDSQGCWDIGSECLKRVPKHLVIFRQQRVC